MKRILIALLCLVSVSAHAQTVENDLVGLGVKPEVASYLSGIIPAGAALDNNVYLKSDNAAGSATIDILRVDASDDTQLNADSGDAIKASVAGTPVAQLDASNVATTASVAIGVASVSATPAARLHVTGSGSTVLLQPSNAANAQLVLKHGSVSASSGLKATSAPALVLQANDIDVATVDGSGLAFTNTGDTLAIDSGTAASACKGTGTHNGTTAVTVSTTCAATGMHVSLTHTSDPTGSTAAYCWVTNIVNGTSFDVDCDQANDGAFSWVIIKEG